MKSMLPVFFALATGFFWGTYGPVLAQARGYEKSPFKPYVMIGVAYLVWGILGGLIGMVANKDSFNFTRAGTAWGFAAGSLGAFGALTLTLAMYNKGVPHVVMPIVFGSAVSVTALVSVFTSKANADPRLWVGIVGMAVCIVTVAYYTPHSAPPPAPAATATGTPSPEESK